MLLANFLKSSLILAALFSLSGCSNSYVENIDRRDFYNYRPGYPELNMAATAYINEDNTPKLRVTGDLVKGSLIYKTENDKYVASISYEIRIRKTSAAGNISISEDFEDFIITDYSDIVNSQSIYTFEKEYEVEPGDVLVEVILTDKYSNRKTMREYRTSVPTPETEQSAITNVSLLTKNSEKEDNNFTQATTYDIPSRYDSLRFRFQAVNRNQQEPLSVEMRLLKFESDFSIARPMNYNDYAPASIEQYGIDYDEYEVIQSSVRDLPQIGNVVIEYNFQNLERGNYRLEVKTDSEMDEEQIYKAIEFGIKSPNYPSLKTPLELARPLYYLMTKKEYENLMALDDPEEMKSAIDRFWLSYIRNSSKAKSVISLYYERVEEANKQFSNFKEGWKTDPGMLYILFGSPAYVNISMDQMIWAYVYNPNDPERNFIFDRPKQKNKYYPFDNFVLRRSSNYFNLQRRQIERWLSGRILNKSF